MAAVLAALATIALLVYLWKNRSVIREFGTALLRAVKWSRRLVKPALYVAASMVVISFGSWRWVTSQNERALQDYLKAHPEYIQKSEDLSFLSARDRLAWLQDDERVAAKEQRDRDFKRTFDAFLDAMSKAEREKLPNYKDWANKAVIDGTLAPDVDLNTLAVRRKYTEFINAQVIRK
jgi:hypothetical protein